MDLFSFYRCFQSHHYESLNLKNLIFIFLIAIYFICDYFLFFSLICILLKFFLSHSIIVLLLLFQIFFSTNLILQN